MARKKTLLSLLQDLRVELRQSGNAAHNKSVRDTQVRLIQKAQERLWDAHDWPHLRVRREISLQAGQRYYGFPSDISAERCEMIEVRYAGRWIPLEYGINPGHYDAWDSDLDERSWPAERWRLHEDDMFEIWPVPSDNATASDKEGVLRVTGIRNLAPLVNDDDRAEIDDQLIVLHAAARSLAASGSQDAGIALRDAEQRERRLTGSFSKKKTFSLLGGGGTGRKLNGPPRVHYRTTS